MLNNTLTRYGPQADAVRKDLRSVVASGIKRDWPDENLGADIPPAVENSNLMETFQDKLDQLSPANDMKRELLAKAQQISSELAMSRWLVIEQSTTNLPKPLFVALVFWLSVLFMGLGLFAPHNKTTLASSIIGGFSVSIVIFLINDMSHPLKGLITLSSASMHDVWNHLNGS